ncbi:deoxyguanosinetriphosphate triphosphohydrolase [Bacillus sp. JCM 19046]|nr:deoxyguanosinetriphosphate triphosphohydrolase [Bacillus sp. JCM 19045]GAF17043.1 deoxyguanosinetriphosphate triphosphohydrolase [Bacillus sp. JCM 19046]
MQINDPLYGSFSLESVLVELLQSEPLERLKGVYQGGASPLVHPSWNVTRYDHSLGTMLLVKRLGASVEEQIAALLHDVSHTAFSHVVDYVFDNEQEDYHEKIFEKTVKASTIPSIVKRAGLDWEALLLKQEKWTLLEQAAPELCADRVDYTLRDMYTYGHISLPDAHRFLEQLIVHNGKMYCSNLLAAEWFVETYYKEVIGFFMDPLNVYGNDRLATLLRTALNKKVLQEANFLLRDKDILAKLSQSQDEEIHRLLQQFERPINVELGGESDKHIKTKLRLIDPSILSEGKLVPASQLSEKVATTNKAAKKKTEAGIYLK